MIGLRLALVGLLCLAVPAGHQRAAEAQEPGESSLASWLDHFATQLERIADGPRGGVSITLSAGRGVEERRVERVVGPHLRRRLESGGVVGRHSDRAPHRVKITVSLEADRVWAVGMITGGELPAPVVIAQDWPIDRELETLLGLRPPRTGQGRWSMERLGTLPPGVLDLLMLDLDNDGGDDVVVLSIDGVRTFLWSPLEGRPVLTAGPVPLDESATWGRLIQGWIAWDGEQVQLATTAGHHQTLRLDTLQGTPMKHPGVPLRQPRDASRSAWVMGQRSADQVDLRVPGMPGDHTVRDAARWPGRDDVWLWVDSDGLLEGVGPTGAHRFPERRVGDRIVLADLDGAAGPELVTTEPSAPGAPDRVRIHSVSPTLDGLTVLFEGVVGGPITAMAAGDLDFDGLGDLLLVEQTDGDSVLWMVRRRS